jgi:hypothetical protein
MGLKDGDAQRARRPLSAHLMDGTRRKRKEAGAGRGFGACWSRNLKGSAVASKFVYRQTGACLGLQ